MHCTSLHTHLLPYMCSRRHSPGIVSKWACIKAKADGSHKWSTSIMTASPVAKAKPLIRIIHSQSRLLVSRKRSSHCHKSPNLPTEKFDLWGIPQTPLLIVDVPPECCTRFQSPRGPSPGTGQIVSSTHAHIRQGFRGIDLRGTIKLLLIVTVATDNSPLGRVWDPSSARLIFVMRCARLATRRNMADFLSLISWSETRCRGIRDGSVCDKHTDCTVDTERSGNLQGLDWPCLSR